MEEEHRECSPSFPSLSFMMSPQLAPGSQTYISLHDANFYRIQHETLRNGSQHSGKIFFHPKIKVRLGQRQIEEHEECLSKSSELFNRLPEIIFCPGLISSLLPFFSSPSSALAEASLQAKFPPVSNPNAPVPHFPADMMRNSMEKVKGQLGAVPGLQNTATAGNGLPENVHPSQRHSSDVLEMIH